MKEDKMDKKKIAISIGILCMILTIGICIQIKTVNSTNSTATVNSKENSLRDEVLKYKEKYDNKCEELEDAETELEKVREETTGNNEELTELEEEIKEGNMLLGLTEVTGEGVVITLKDSSAISSSILDASNLIVHDMDVLSVINELKNAGAEAISINEQRLVSTTAIVCDGNVIQINGQKVGAPFEIKAIGLPEQLLALDRPGGYLSYLKEYGISAEIVKSSSVTIPKYTGSIDFKYAQTQ
jgi:uncharacterized protein YlxW (UPF0749 family)